MKKITFSLIMKNSFLWSLIVSLSSSLFSFNFYQETVFLISRRVIEIDPYRQSQKTQDDRWIESYQNREISSRTNPKAGLEGIMPLSKEDVITTPPWDFSLKSLSPSAYQGPFISKEDAITLLDALPEGQLPSPVKKFLKSVLKGQFGRVLRAGGIATRFNRSSGVTTDVKIDDPKGLIGVYQSEEGIILRFLDAFLLDVRAQEILVCRLLHNLGIYVDPSRINIPAVIITSSYTHERTMEYLESKQA
ncbi:MAG: hypothetical protein NC927_01205, partial [Candidatus Omnitrophica bacterium]|nr:hypothetical protein [Candidatus Omnitrophota bacterium]